MAALTQEELDALPEGTLLYTAGRDLKTFECCHEANDHVSLSYFLTREESDENIKYAKQLNLLGHNTDEMLGFN